MRSSDRSQTSGLISAGCLLMAGVVTVLALQSPGRGGVQASLPAYLVIAVAMVALGIVGVRWLSWRRAKEPPVLHSPVLITGYVVLLIALPGAFLFISPDTFDPTGIVRHEYLVYGMALVLGGLLSLWAGYLAGLHAFRPSDGLRRLAARPLSPTVVMWLFGITVLVRALRILTSGIGYSADVTATAGAFTQWVSYLESFRYLVLALVSIGVFRGVWPRWMFFTVLGVELVFAFASGFMKPILWLGLVVGISALVTGVRIRKYVRYLAPLALAAILIVPVAQGIRYHILIYRIDTRSPTVVLQNVWSLLTTTMQADAGAAWTAFAEYVPARLGFVAYMPGLAISRTPSMVPFLGFDRLLETPLYLLPRAIWTEKPVLTRSRWFSVHYLDMPPDTPSSTAITIFGETYLFAGWITVILGLFLLGLLLALIYHNTVGVGLLAIYFTLVPSLVDVESEFTTKVVALVQGGIMMLLGYWLLTVVSRAVEPRRSPAWVRPPAAVSRP